MHRLVHTWTGSLEATTQGRASFPDLVDHLLSTLEGSIVRGSGQLISSLKGIHPLGVSGGRSNALGPIGVIDIGETNPLVGGLST